MKNILKSPWTIGITTTLLGFFLAVVYDFIKKKQFLSTVKTILLALRNGLVAFLNFELKVWWILLGIAGLLLLLIIVADIKGKGKDSESDFMGYTEDYFGNWKWSWKWKYNTYKTAWCPSDFEAHCPECDTPMFHDRDEYFFQCPRCGFESSGMDDHKKSYEVDALIVDNINRKRRSQK